MVVLCERCRTRFQLDDCRIPARGIRVRCSRCKHAFFLKPTADAPKPRPVPAAPLEQPATPAPEDGGSADWESSGSTPAAAPLALGDAETPAPNGPRGESDPDESDWEFNTDFSLAEPEEAGAASAEPIPTEESAAAQESGRLSLDDVGDPENWDLLAEEDLEMPGPEPVRGERSHTEPERRPVVSSEPVRAAPRTAPSPREPAPVRSAPAGGHSLVGELLGWMATALLLVVAAHGSLRISAQTSPAHPSEDLAGLTIERVHGRWVENALGGALYVVSGRLRNETMEPRSLEALLVVNVLRESGAPIAGLRARVGRALPPRRLRQVAPEQLREELRRSALTLAREPLAPGEALEFDALFEKLPDEARRLRVEAAPLPAREEKPARMTESEDPDARARGELTASRTSSLPPAALPSSE